MIVQRREISGIRTESAFTGQTSDIYGRLNNYGFSYKRKVILC